MKAVGGFAAGTNLATLCNRMRVTLLDDIIINSMEDFGTAVKNSVCSKATQVVVVPSCSC